MVASPQGLDHLFLNVIKPRPHTSSETLKHFTPLFIPPCLPLLVLEAFIGRSTLILTTLHPHPPFLFLSLCSFSRTWLLLMSAEC